MTSSRAQNILPIITFAFSAFVFNTTEFVPVALLSSIGASFQLPVEKVGLMITVYAWVVSLMSLPIMLLTAKLERKSLLIKLFFLFFICHLLSAFAWNFAVLLIARVAIALIHALFWSIAASLVIRLAAPDKKTQALGWFSLGSALATILGLPIGRLIADFLNWRATFFIIGCLALMVMLLFWKLLPKLPSQNAGSLRSLPLLIKRPLLIGIYVFTLLTVSAHFIAYSYIEPFALQLSSFSNWNITALLLMFGASGMIGSIIFSLFHNRFPNAFMLVSIALLIASTALLYPLHTHFYALFVLTLPWGLGFTGLALGMQIRVLQLAEDASDVANAIYSGIFNIGIGNGALIGGLVVQFLGLGNIGFVGAAVAILAALCWVYISRYQSS